MSKVYSLVGKLKELDVLRLVALCFITSIFLLPNITISSSLPVVRFEDLLAFLMFLTILLINPLKDQWDLSLTRYLKFTLVFMGWIVITQLGNGRISYISDYFEYYKSIKYIIVVFFFYLVAREADFKLTNSFSYIRIAFYVAFVLNMFNYFNILDFNQWVMPYFSNTLQLGRFGVDSLGDPDVKRMLGVMGNPNDNAIIMGFFSVLFITSGTQVKGIKKQDLLCAGLALLMLVMSGSKTAVLSLLAVFLMYWVLSKANLKYLLYLSAIAIGIVLFINFAHLTYLSSLWTIDWSANASWTGRLEVWQELIAMIKKSPWIGYGPNKDFFYINNLYSENEYILMAWRYGIIGLLGYMLWILMPFWVAFKNRRLMSSKIVILFATYLLVSATTNNPLSEPRVLVLYAMITGIMFANCAEETRYKKKELIEG